MEESIEAVLRSARLVRTDARRRAQALIDGFPGPAGLTPSPSPSPATSPSPPALMDEPDFDEVICAAEATPQKKHRPRRKKKVAPTDSTADTAVEPAVPYRPKSNSVFDRLSHPRSFPKAFVYKHIIKNNERVLSGGKNNGDMSFFSKSRASRGHPFLDSDIAGAAASPAAVRKQKSAQPKTPQSKRREHPPPKTAATTLSAPRPPSRVSRSGGTTTSKKAKKKPKMKTAVADTPAVKKKRRPHPFLDSDSPYKDQSPRAIRRGKAPHTATHTAVSVSKRQTAQKRILQAIDNESLGRLDASDAFKKAVTDLLTKNSKWVQNDAGSAEREATVVTAVCSGKVGAAIFLLDHGAQVTTVRKSDGRGLLHLLLEHDLVDITALDAFVESGVPINSTDYSGMTALHVACSRRSTDANKILFTLLEHNADVGVKDGSGKTPDNYAADHPGMMDMLSARSVGRVASPSRALPTVALPVSSTISHHPLSPATAAAAAAAAVVPVALAKATAQAAKVTLSPEIAALKDEVELKFKQADSLDVTIPSKKRLADLLRNQAKELQTLVDLELPDESGILAPPEAFHDTNEGTPKSLDPSLLARQKRQAKRESLVSSAGGSPKSRSTSLSERSPVAYSPRDAQLDYQATVVETADDVFAMKPSPTRDDTAMVNQQRQNLKERLHNQRLQREGEHSEMQRQQEADAATAAAAAAAEVDMLRKQLEDANAEAARAREMRETLEREKAAVEKIQADAKHEREKVAESKRARAEAERVAVAIAARNAAAEEDRIAAEKESEARLEMQRQQEAEVDMLRKQLEDANAEAARAREMRETLEREKAAVEKIQADAEHEREKVAESERARAEAERVAVAIAARNAAAEEDRIAAEKESEARLAAQNKIAAAEMEEVKIAQKQLEVQKARILSEQAVAVEAKRERKKAVELERVRAAAEHAASVAEKVRRDAKDKANAELAAARAAIAAETERALLVAEREIARAAAASDAAEQSPRARLAAEAKAKGVRSETAGITAVRKNAAATIVHFHDDGSSEPEDDPPPLPPPLGESPPRSPEPVRSQSLAMPSFTASPPAVANANAKRNALRSRVNLSASKLSGSDSAAAAAAAAAATVNGGDFYSDSGSQDDHQAELEAPDQRQREALNRAKLRARVARVQQVRSASKDFYSDSDGEEEDSVLDAEKQRAREDALLRVKNRRAAALN